MDMKNTKAIFFIILGNFLLATGFAFAEDKPALAALKEWAGNDAPAVEKLDAAGVTNKLPLTKAKAKGIDLLSKGVVAPAVSSAPEAKKEETKTLGQNVKEWVGKNFSNILAAAAIGFLGFLMIGTGVGGIAVGLAALGFFIGMRAL